MHAGIELLRGAIFRALRPRCRYRRRLHRLCRGRCSRCGDRLQLRQARRIDRNRSGIARRQPIALVPAIDTRIFQLPRGRRIECFVDFPRISIERTRIEVHRLEAERLRHGGADGTRIAERRGFHRAERRRDQMIVRIRMPAVRDERRKVLIADRGRHQCGETCAEPETRRERRADHAITRIRDATITPHANTRATQRTQLRKRHRSGANSTVLFIVELTLRRR